MNKRERKRRLKILEELTNGVMIGLQLAAFFTAAVALYLLPTRYANNIFNAVALIYCLIQSVELAVLRINKDRWKNGN